MKKMFFVIVFCVLFSLPASFAFAQDSVSKVTFNVAPETCYVYYEEPDLMDNKGFLWGVAADVVYNDGVNRCGPGRL